MHISKVCLFGNPRLVMASLLIGCYIKSPQSKGDAITYQITKIEVNKVSEENSGAAQLKVMYATHQ